MFESVSFQKCCHIITNYISSHASHSEGSQSTQSSKLWKQMKSCVRLFLRNVASVGPEGGTCYRVCSSTTQMFLWARREESTVCYRSEKNLRRKLPCNMIILEKKFLLAQSYKNYVRVWLLSWFHWDSLLILDNPQVELFPSLHFYWEMCLCLRAWQSQNTVPESFKS